MKFPYTKRLCSFSQIIPSTKKSYRQSYILFRITTSTRPHQTFFNSLFHSFIYFLTHTWTQARMAESTPYLSLGQSLQVNDLDEYDWPFPRRWTAVTKQTSCPMASFIRRMLFLPPQAIFVFLLFEPDFSTTSLLSFDLITFRTRKLLCHHLLSVKHEVSITFRDSNVLVLTLFFVYRNG